MIQNWLYSIPGERKANSKVEVVHSTLKHLYITRARKPIVFYVAFIQIKHFGIWKLVCWIIKEINLTVIIKQYSVCYHDW